MKETPYPKKANARFTGIRIISGKTKEPQLENAGKHKKPGIKITFNKKYLSKRLSPFLLMLPVLIFLLMYRIITATGAIQNKWLIVFWFNFLIINILFADFAIWNYFEGKKRWGIWICELAASALIIYVLL